MNDLSRYIQAVIEPTFDEFLREPSSRRAFLVCVVIFHAVDRVTFPKKPSILRQEWCRKSLEFKLVDVVAHHFKHVKSTDERAYSPDKPGLPISLALGFNERGDEMELRNFSFVMRDAITFLRREVEALAKRSEVVEVEAQSSSEAS